MSIGTSSSVQFQQERLDALYADIQQLDKKEQEVPIRLKPISPLLACHLCSGYLVNATAITECLHVFCRSCLIKHLQVNQECPDCGEKVIVSAEGALRYDRTLQDLIHLLVPRVFENELKRENDFNNSLRRISLEGSLWHNKKQNLWRNCEVINPRIRINLIHDQTRADKFLRVCMRMPLYHIINLIKEKFLKSSTSSDPIIELRCNEFYLMNSQFEQLENRKTNVRQVFMRYWYPKPQPLEIAFREKIV